MSKPNKRRKSRRTLKAKTKFAGEVATGKRPNLATKRGLPKRLRKDYDTPKVEQPGIVKIPLDEVKERMGNGR